MSIGPSELLILSALAALVVVIWAIVDAAGHPSSSWDRIGKSKSAWIAMMAVFYLLCGIVGLILAIVYLASIRNQLVAATTGRSLPPPPDAVDVTGEVPGASTPPAKRKPAARHPTVARPGEAGYCSQCGGHVEPTWKHCPDCGSPVVGIPHEGA